jgi:hypothetical protein
VNIFQNKKRITLLFFILLRKHKFATDWFAMQQQVLRKMYKHNWGWLKRLGISQVFFIYLLLSRQNGGKVFNNTLF